VSFKASFNLTYVKWIPCQHGMARPQAAGEGDSLYITTNIAQAAADSDRGDKLSILETAGAEDSRPTA
jgi:hypothetical protein